jgi:peroxiredoxin
VRHAWRRAAFAAAVLFAGGVPAARAEDPPKPADPPKDAPSEEPPAAPPREERGIPVGARAPDLDVPGWVNVEEGKAPTAESLKGKLILVEFWATTCGPCVRTMPKVQAIHDRYGPRGLVVLAMSPDPAFKQTQFAALKGLTFPMGIDSSDSVRKAYQVDGIPTTYLIGRDGNVAGLTSPMHADVQIDQLLGYTAGPTGPLDDYLAAVAAKDASSARFHVERAIPRGTVDLAAWAKAAGGVPVALPPGAKIPPPPKGFDVQLLNALALARVAGDEKRAKSTLDSLASIGPAAFDLSAWAKEVCARDYPVTVKELKELADAKRFDVLVDAILDRKPSPAALDGVVKLPALQEHAAKGARRERLLARKAVMILTWPLGGKFFKDEEKNRKFWDELGSSGWVEDKDKKPIAMDVEGTMIFKDSGPAQVERWLSRAVVMDALTAGKKPDLAKLKADVAKARGTIDKELKAAYGE